MGTEKRKGKQVNFTIYKIASRETPTLLPQSPISTNEWKRNILFEIDVAIHVFRTFEQVIVVGGRVREMHLEFGKLRVTLETMPLFYCALLVLLMNKLVAGKLRRLRVSRNFFFLTHSILSFVIQFHFVRNRETVTLQMSQRQGPLSSSAPTWWHEILQSDSYPVPQLPDSIS